MRGLEPPRPTTPLGIDVDAELKKLVKEKAKGERITLRQIVEDAFQKYLERPPINSSNAQSE